MDQLKPSDRVLAYLKREIGLDHLEPGTRLPPVRQIAIATNVSHGTARNILQKLANQGYVEIKPGSGASWIREPQSKVSDMVIGVNTIKPDVQPTNLNMQWLYRVYGGITQGALRQEISLRVKPILRNRGNKGDLSGVEYDVKELEHVDGFILFPFHGFRELEKILKEKKIPHVYFNPPHWGTTEGFVSSAYFEICERIGKVWSEVGKQRVLGIFSPGPDKSVSCQLMSAGLMSGLAMAREQLPEVHKISLEVNDKPVAEQAFGALLDKGWIPDAVLCKADVIAEGVLSAARKRGIRVPEQMSVIGGNGMSYYEPVRSTLTAIRQPVEEIGERLIQMLVERIANPDKTLAGVYLPGSILTGETTSEEENKLLS